MSNNKNYIEIIFEDEFILAVNKPAGILSIPDRFKPELPNVKDLLEKKYPKIFTVHRLDKFTSGVMVFAKQAEAHKSLNELFQNRKVEKKYWALTEGIPNPIEGTINLSIGPNNSRPGKMKISKQGKSAITHYKVVREFENIALVEAKIDTGRTHQIRLHLKSLGTPLLVDKDYGNAEGWFLSSLKRRKFRKGKSEEERPLLSRLSLHARSLKLIHPMLKEEMKFEAGLPKDLRATLKQLEKWSSK